VCVEGRITKDFEGESGLRKSNREVAIGARGNGCARWETLRSRRETLRTSLEKALLLPADATSMLQAATLSAAERSHERASKLCSA